MFQEEMLSNVSGVIQLNLLSDEVTNEPSFAPSSFPTEAQKDQYDNDGYSPFIVTGGVLTVLMVGYFITQLLIKCYSFFKYCSSYSGNKIYVDDRDDCDTGVEV